MKQRCNLRYKDMDLRALYPQHLKIQKQEKVSDSEDQHPEKGQMNCMYQVQESRHRLWQIELSWPANY